MKSIVYGFAVGFIPLELLAESFSSGGRRLPSLSLMLMGAALQAILTLPLFT